MIWTVHQQFTTALLDNRDDYMVFTGHSSHTSSHFLPYAMAYGFVFLLLKLTKSPGQIWARPDIQAFGGNRLDNARIMSWTHTKRRQTHKKINFARNFGGVQANFGNAKILRGPITQTPPLPELPLEMEPICCSKY